MVLIHVGPLIYVVKLIDVYGNLETIYVRGFQLGSKDPGGEMQ